MRQNVSPAPEMLSKRSLEKRIGIIVIGRNEGARLEKCLESLRMPGPALVYVDSASTDGSPDMARERGAQVIDLDMRKPFTAARARNEGFAKLQTFSLALEYVQFVDGDCEVEKDWIATAVDFLDDHEDVAVVCGRRRERYPHKSFYNEICDREWNTPVGEAQACGGDALVRVDELARVGGYNQHLIAGEEPEMCSRLRANGMRIWRIDAPMTVHDAAMYHFGQWWLRAVRSGFGYAQVWYETRKTLHALYSRELLRAVFWALALPLACILAAFLYPLSFVMFPIIYGAQIARLAMREGVMKRMSWKMALLNVGGKFAEMQGILRFAVRFVLRRKGGTIFYK